MTNDQSYGSGSLISWGEIGTTLSGLYTSVKSILPFTSPAEPVNEGVMTDFLGNVYVNQENLSGLSEQAQVNRLATQAAKDPSGQSGECAWWNVGCKVSKNVSAVTASAGEFVSSTLTKALIIVVVVGVLALFVMSYAQAKGGQLAK